MSEINRDDESKNVSEEVKKVMNYSELETLKALVSDENFTPAQIDVLIAKITTRGAAGVLIDSKQPFTPRQIDALLAKILSGSHATRILEKDKPVLLPDQTEQLIRLIEYSVDAEWVLNNSTRDFTPGQRQRLEVKKLTGATSYER